MHGLTNNFSQKYEELKEKNKELEKFLLSQKETFVTFSIEDIKILINAGCIPKELSDFFFKNLEEKRKLNKEMQEFIKNNPDIPVKESHERFFREHKSFLKEGALSPGETAKLYEDITFEGQLLMCLLQNRHRLKNLTNNLTETKKSLFKNVDVNKEFGIANCISNSLYHLEELLKNMVLDKLYENTYEARSSIKNTRGEAIALSYSFQALTQEEAEAILTEYKSIMLSKGLKVWLSYWVMANKQGRTEYTCPMIEIMKLMADEEREAFFSVKEKEEYWSLTKILGMSKLSRERKKRKRKSEFLQWVEQPLVEILGGEKQMTAEDKYPIYIAARVLMPRLDKLDTKGFSPSIYKNTTLDLSPSDTFLAFKIQTRATQMEHGNKDLHVDWDFIFEAGNLEATALSNQRGAKAKARKKMDRLKDNEIIEKWDEELMGLRVTPKKQERKS